MEHPALGRRRWPVLLAALVLAGGVASAAPLRAQTGTGLGQAQAVPQVAEKQARAKKKARRRRVRLAPVFMVSRAFRNAPPPGFSRLTLATRSSDKSHEEETDIRLLSSNGVVLEVIEKSVATYRSLDDMDWRQTVESHSHYVLGGLMFVEGEWTATREKIGGHRETVKEGAETADFQKVAGKLFPLAVGNRLKIVYRSRIKTAREFTDNETVYRVMRKFDARIFDKRLSGHIFVIDAQYKQTMADEVATVREEIYYATDLGWPVRIRRKDVATKVTVETRLVDFVRRKSE